MKIAKIEIAAVLLLIAYILISMYGRANSVMANFSVEDGSYNDHTKLVILPFIGLSIVLLFKRGYDFCSGFNALFVIWLFIVSLSNFFFIPFDRFISYTLQQSLWFLSSYLFYNLGKKNIDPLVLALCIGFMCIFMAFCVYNELYVIRNFVVYASKAQVNEIYFLLCMMPWVMLIDGKYLKFMKYFLLTMILGLTFYSMKRAAILGLIVFWVFYLWGLVKQNRFNRKNLILFIVISIVCFLSFNYVDEMYGGHLANRIESMESDGGGGRLDLYSMIISSLDDFEIYNWLIGAGRGSIKGVADGHSAHNEYLEVFYSWGVLGLGIYISILYKYFKKIKYCIKTDYFPICMGSIGMFVSMSMVTHFVINPYLMCIFTSFWSFMIIKQKFA